MSFRSRRILFVVGAVFVMVVSTLSATNRASAQANPMGRLRFVHGVPGAPAADILVDKVLAATGLEYASATRYLMVAPGDHEVTVTATGSTTPLVQGNVTVGSDPLADT